MPSFDELKELKRYGRGDTLPEGAPPEPPDSSGIYLYDEEKGTGVWLTHYVSDGQEDLTDADFDFSSGKEWGEKQLDEDDD